mmetsp:Transcript_130693/g.378085  ORF Transcript_130693/g.378085 Transcript_130693/m.378085 type:complete len:221 (+) Transcript_130693:99-761(+)
MAERAGRQGAHRGCEASSLERTSRGARSSLQNGKSDSTGPAEIMYQSELHRMFGGQPLPDLHSMQGLTVKNTFLEFAEKKEVQEDRPSSDPTSSSYTSSCDSSSSRQSSLSRKPGPLSNASNSYDSRETSRPSANEEEKKRNKGKSKKGSRAARMVAGALGQKDNHWSMDLPSIGTLVHMTAEAGSGQKCTPCAFFIGGNCKKRSECKDCHHRSHAIISL